MSQKIMFSTSVFIGHNTSDVRLLIPFRINTIVIKQPSSQVTNNQYSKVEVVVLLCLRMFI